MSNPKNCPFCNVEVKKTVFFNIKSVEHPENDCFLCGKTITMKLWENRHAKPVSKEAMSEWLYKHTGYNKEPCKLITKAIINKYSVHERNE